MLKPEHEIWCVLCVPLNWVSVLLFSNYRYASFFCSSVMKMWWAMAHMLFLGCVLPHIKVLAHSKRLFLKITVRTFSFIYLFFMKVDLRLAEREGGGPTGWIAAFQSGGQGMLWHCTVCDGRGFPFRQHQCDPLSSLSAFQSNYVCLNDVYCSFIIFFTWFLFSQLWLQFCAASWSYSVCLSFRKSLWQTLVFDPVVAQSQCSKSGIRYTCSSDYSPTWCHFFKTQLLKFCFAFSELNHIWTAYFCLAHAGCLRGKFITSRTGLSKARSPIILWVHSESPFALLIWGHSFTFCKSVVKSEDPSGASSCRGSVSEWVHLYSCLVCMPRKFVQIVNGLDIQTCKCLVMVSFDCVPVVSQRHQISTNVFLK